RWDGEELLIHSWSDFRGLKLEWNDRWRQTENGTTLIVTRQGVSAGGKYEQTLVLDKQ
ncbi:MAG: hypothetical protein JO022_10005, partial [Acidobacteriaceae bacterium]|nr:hypothetical protein [Acidobacteriaceae bacterium]